MTFEEIIARGHQMLGATDFVEHLAGDARFNFEVTLKIMESYRDYMSKKREAA